MISLNTDLSLTGKFLSNILYSRNVDKAASQGV